MSNEASPVATNSWTPPKTPFLAVDIVVYYPKPNPNDTQIVVIERKYPPLGYALPGGFVDYGESVETAAVREAKEELALAVELDRLIGVFSDPNRDPRKHVASCAYLAHAVYPEQMPIGMDDAKKAHVVRLQDLHKLQWCFDHQNIVMQAAAILMSAGCGDPY